MPNNARAYSFLDRICIHVDQTLRTLSNNPLTTERQNPAKHIKEGQLTQHEKRLSAGLMRVNHAGEVCAQALYQGQALTSKSEAVKAKMKEASLEENDHLAWCESRVSALGSHTSILNPLFYTGSLMLGITAGLIGDKWNLGFLAETENQVVKHLESHQTKLPKNDYKSRAIVDQMIVDEGEHETSAIDAGAHALPALVKNLMRLTSKLMTFTARWI